MSRRDLFVELDRPALQPLPLQRFEHRAQTLVFLEDLGPSIVCMHPRPFRSTGR